MLQMQMQQYEYFWCVSNANTIEMEKKKQQIAEEMKMSNYDRSNCKCDVNVTHPARYHNIGQIGHKLLIILSLP